MSSFKKRTATVPIPGTKSSPFNSLIPLLSTGLASLDDLLGGGLPLSSSLLLESDVPTSYADLLLKFWIAQGVECKQDVILVSSGLELSPNEIIRGLMGVQDAVVGPESDEETEKVTEKLKIAFRYEGMKQHAVEVPKAAPVSNRGDDQVYCSNFDLTTVMPLRASNLTRLHLIDIETMLESSSDVYESLYDRLESLILEKGYSKSLDPNAPRRALRIALHSVASPAWGPTNPLQLYRFLTRLRTLLRSSSASAVLTIPGHLYSSTPSFLRRLEYTSDGVIEIQSFAASPLLSASFPKHNGLLRIPKLPSLGSLVPPSAKLSVLRGLGGGGGDAGGGLDLGFRIKRRRFIIEPLRDDSNIGGVEEKKVVKAEVKVEEKVIERDSKVSFAGEEKMGKKKPQSVSALLHKSPELYEF